MRAAIARYGLTRHRVEMTGARCRRPRCASRSTRRRSSRCRAWSRTTGDPRRDPGVAHGGDGGGHAVGVGNAGVGDTRGSSTHERLKGLLVPERDPDRRWRADAGAPARRSEPRPAHGGRRARQGGAGVRRRRRGAQGARVVRRCPPLASSRRPCGSDGAGERLHAAGRRRRRSQVRTLSRHLQQLGQRVAIITPLLARGRQVTAERCYRIPVGRLRYPRRPLVGGGVMCLRLAVFCGRTAGATTRGTFISGITSARSPASSACWWASR